MRLLACHVENFGKLSNFRMEFSEGINTIDQPNGWGKSTLAAFLKAMLYGLDNRKEPGEFEKERKKYAPWQGGAFGGELDIEVNGKAYRISRFFGATEKTDRFHLYDLQTNLESTDYSSDIGTELFDLDRTSFKRTIFIAQNDCSTGSSDSINAKLGNLAQASDDINNYEKAMENIRSRMNHLSPKRSTGSLHRRRNTITQLEQELKSLSAAEKAADELQTRMHGKQEQTREMIQLRSEYAQALIIASEDSRRKEQAKNYRKMQADLKEKEYVLQEYAASFPDGIPTEEEFAVCQNLILQLESQNASLNHLTVGIDEEAETRELQQQFADGIPDQNTFAELAEKSIAAARDRKWILEQESRLNEMEQNYVRESARNQVNLQPAKSLWLPAGILMLFLGIAALAVRLFYFQMTGSTQGTAAVISLAAGIAFTILGITGIILALQNQKHNAAETAHRLEERDRCLKALQDPIRETTEELGKRRNKTNEAEKEIESFLKKYPFTDPLLPQTDQIYQVKAKATRLQALQDKHAGYQRAYLDKNLLISRLQEMAGKIGVAYSDHMPGALSRIQSRVAEYYMLRDEYRKAKEEKNRFEKENDIAAILAPQKCPFTLEELQKLIKEADINIEQLRSASDQYFRQLEDLKQQLDLREEKEQALSQAKEDQAKEAQEYEVLELTQYYLQKSKEAFVARYMGPITSAFRKYYRILTGETADEWMIDADLCLKLREKGQMRETHWLSAGYQDLLGVCLRMALVEAMFPEEKPFLVFDDPFVNLDDEKMENGKNFLKGLSGEYQSIYFTCHESRLIEKSRNQ